MTKGKAIFSCAECHYFDPENHGKGHPTYGWCDWYKEAVHYKYAAVGSGKTYWGTTPGRCELAIKVFDAKQDRQLREKAEAMKK